MRDALPAGEHPVSPRNPQPDRGAATAAGGLHAHPWSQTPLGPIEDWPEVLRAFAELVFASHFPMLLLWGPELVQIFNDSYAEILGGDPSTSLGRPAVRASNEATYQRVQEGETLRFENRFFPVLRGGLPGQACFTLSYSPVRDRGAVAGILLSAFETTAEVRAEARRRAAEQDMLQMLESLPQVTWTADTEGQITGVSPRWLELTGMTREEATGHGWTRAPHPDDLPRMSRAWEHATRTGEPYDVTSRIRTASGEYRSIRAQALPFHDSHGVVTQWIGTVEDIHERVKTLEALESSNERLRLAQEAAVLATWDWDLASGRLTWTGEYTRLYGRSRDELDHIDRFFEYVHPDDVEATTKATRVAIEGRGDYFHEFRIVWPDASIHWVEGRGRPILGDGGGPSRIIGVNLDITRRKQAEAALLQTEKLAAVGRLASSIAHEINNPLESMMNLLYLVGTGQELTSESRKFLDLAEAELRRAAHITAQALRFHRQSTNSADTDIGELLDSVVSLYGFRLRGSGVDVLPRYSRPVKLVCHESDIRQVLNNLIGNALDALRSGGRLFLRARPATDWRSGRRGVRITVADTGCGMSTETRKHLFDAFYTTKGDNGNGLGLWVSKGIIDRHKGRLCLKSSQGSHRHGTVFCLFLPHTPLPGNKS